MTASCCGRLERSSQGHQHLFQVLFIDPLVLLFSLTTRVGIKRSLPGLDRFLKIDLRSQTLSGEAKTELDRLVSLLVDLEKTAGENGSLENGVADRAGKRVASGSPAHF